MTWYFHGNAITEPPEDALGFVYIIENLTNGKKYIGKKLFSFAKTTYRTVKLKNGNKKRKKIKSRITSDWETYFGSNEELKKDVQLLGEQNFKREIVKFCSSKNELSYYEAKYQFDHNVLIESEKWYNKWISVKARSFVNTDQSTTD